MPRRINKPYLRVVSSSKREEWLDARRTGIGASEVSSILGWNPYESAFTLFQKKLGVVEVADNDPMKWGRRLERAIGDGYAEDTGRKVWGGGIMLRSKKFPWLFATPDREQRANDWDDDGLLEIKTTGQHNLEDWSEDAPIWYQLQLQQQLLVTGKRHGTLCCLIGGQTLRWKDYERHDEVTELIVRKSQEFWENLRQGIAPPIDSSESTYETLRAMSDTGLRVDLPEEAVQWHFARQAAHDAERAAKTEKAKYTRLLASAIGDASVGVLPKQLGVYNFKTYSIKEYTVPAKSYRKMLLGGKEEAA